MSYLEFRQLYEELVNLRDELTGLVVERKKRINEPTTYDIPKNTCELFRQISEDSEKILRYLSNNPSNMRILREKAVPQKSLGRISDILKNLEKNGYVIRHTSSRGSYDFYLLPEGAKAISTLDNFYKMLNNNNQKIIE